MISRLSRGASLALVWAAVLFGPAGASAQTTPYPSYTWSLEGSGYIYLEATYTNIPVAYGTLTIMYDNPYEPDDADFTFSVVVPSLNIPSPTDLGFSGQLSLGSLSAEEILFGGSGASGSAMISGIILGPVDPGDIRDTLGAATSVSLKSSELYGNDARELGETLNLQLQSYSVPEPSGLVLGTIGTALLGMWHGRARRRR